MNSIGIVIQARMGSTRLPGKVLRDIAGHPLLEHVVKRLDNLQHKVQVVVATSIEQQDNSIVDYCSIQGTPCFRGSEADVLSRYYECAKEYGFNHIIRLTADNPFTDINELDRVIELHFKEGNDYTHSFGDLPLGVGAEIFTFQALERSYHEGHASNHREHVNEYIQEHPENFKIGLLKVARDKAYPHLRLTVDTEDDYQRACYIAEHAQEDWITTEEAINLCLHFV